MYKIDCKDNSIIIRAQTPELLFGIAQKRYSRQEQAFICPQQVRHWLYLQERFSLEDWSPDARAKLQKCLEDEKRRDQNAVMSRKRDLIDTSKVSCRTFGKFKPYEHQQQALALADGLCEFGYFLDQGCVDGETEFLSRDGWVPISQWNGHEVAVCDIDGNARYDVVQLVKGESEHWFHLTHRRGLDQMVTHDHRCVLQYRASGKRIDITPGNIVKKIETNRSNMVCPNTFQMKMTGDGIPFTEQQIRLGIACSADGYFYSKNARGCVVRLKKSRKVERFRKLCGEGWTEKYEEKTGFHVFYGPAPWKRDIPAWGASPEQWAIIREECVNWDGSVNSAGAVRMFSKGKHNADVMAFAFQVAGYQVRTAKDKRKDLSKAVYTATVRRKCGLTFSRGEDNREIFERKPAYCFETSTGYWVARRNGCTFITGNTGKTITVINDASQMWRDGVVQLAIVFAPNSVKTNWRRPDYGSATGDLCELEKHRPEDVPFVTIAHTSSGTREDARQKFMFERSLASNTPALHWLVMNFEAVAAHKNQAYLQELVDRYPTMLIVDESTRIKNPQSARTRALLAISRSARVRRIMSGTPVIKAPENAWSQLRFLGPDAMPFDNITAFKKRYLLTSRPHGFKGPERVEGYQNLEELSNLIDRVSFRVTKDECLDLPAKIYNRREVSMTREQNEAYEEMRKRAYVFIESHGVEVAATIILTQMLRLHQISCGFLPKIDIDTGKATDIVPLMLPEENPKFLEAIDVITECDGKSIVWAHFTPQLLLFSKLLTERGIKHVSFWGGVSDEDRVKAREAFQNDPDVKVFLGNPAAGGIGLTLTAAEQAIYLSNGFSTENRVQSEDRCHRIGSERHKVINYYDILTRDTIDYKIINVLRENKRISNEIMREAWKEWI